MMQALLRLSIVEPIVQVEMPEQMPQLEFIPTIPLPQEITLNATANFNTLEVAKIGYRVNASKVDAYNEEHGTSYQLLPEQYYKIKESDFDTETLEIESRIEFDCAAIGGEGTYLLPARNAFRRLFGRPAGAGLCLDSDVRTQNMGNERRRPRKNVGQGKNQGADELPDDCRPACRLRIRTGEGRNLQHGARDCIQDAGCRQGGRYPD